MSQKQKADEKRNSRVALKSEYMNRFITHSILLNGGAASALFGIVSVKINEPSITNLILLAMSCFLAWNTGTVAECDFERMKVNDAKKSPESELIDQKASGTIKTFKNTIIVGAIIMFLIQLCGLKPEFCWCFCH